MAGGELYMILGLGRGASAEEIKQAYRRLARRLHPDQNADDPVATERFRQVTYAYDVLSNERRRRLYDRRVGSESRPGIDPNPTPHPEPRADPPTEEVEAPIGGSNEGLREASRRSAGSEERTGRKWRGGIRRRGADLLLEVVLTLHEAVRGCERELRIKSGGSATPRVVRVRIPPGARQGEKLRVRGLGRSGARGGEPGDLWLKIEIRSHPHFFFERGELHGDLPITPLEAYAGAVVEVPTPHGALQVRIPSRSQPGMKLRLRGQGMRRGRLPPGDLVLHLRVVLPSDDGLSALYQTLDEALGPDIRRGLSFE